MQGQELKLNVSNNIKYLMEQNNISRKEICSKLGFKYTTFCDWINGRIIPKSENIEKICVYFNVDASSLFLDLETFKRRQEVGPLLTYAGELLDADSKVLELDAIKELSDDQIKSLIDAGFTFKHKTFEERLEANGSRINIYKFDWGEPVGREIW